MFLHIQSIELTTLFAIKIFWLVAELKSFSAEQSSADEANNHMNKMWRVIERCLESKFRIWILVLLYWYVENIFCSYYALHEVWTDTILIVRQWEKMGWSDWGQVENIKQSMSLPLPGVLWKLHETHYFSRHVETTQTWTIYSFFSFMWFFRLLFISSELPLSLLYTHSFSPPTPASPFPLISAETPLREFNLRQISRRVKRSSRFDELKLFFGDTKAECNQSSAA